jgi:hypothetical protein
VIPLGLLKVKTDALRDRTHALTILEKIKQVIPKVREPLAIAPFMV